MYKAPNDDDDENKSKNKEKLKINLEELQSIEESEFTSSDRIKTDIKNLVTAFAISEVIYSVSKVVLHYQLLTLGFIEPYQTSMIASIIAWAIFLLIINLSVKAVHLFKSK